MIRSRKGREIAMLSDAKAALEQRGWQQDGDFADDAGRLSLDGALNYVASGLPDKLAESSADAESLLVAELMLRGHGYDVTLGDWNDEPGRSVADVYELLDDAIAKRKAAR